MVLLVVGQTVQMMNVEHGEWESKVRLPVDVVVDLVEVGDVPEELLDGKRWYSEAKRSNEVSTLAVKVSLSKKTSLVATRSAAAATWERRNQEERTEILS